MCPASGRKDMNVNMNMLGEVGLEIIWKEIKEKCNGNDEYDCSRVSTASDTAYAHQTCASVRKGRQYEKTLRAERTDAKRVRFSIGPFKQ
jgi:hypothetical protein